MNSLGKSANARKEGVNDANKSNNVMDSLLLAAQRNFGWLLEKYPKKEIDSSATDTALFYYMYM